MSLGQPHRDLASPVQPRSSGWLKLSARRVTWRSKTAKLMLAVALPVAIAWGCSAGEEELPNYAGSRMSDRRGVPSDPCATPNDGCACDVPGKVVSCGRVTHDDGDYVSCSMGHRTCEGDQWGTCVGDHDVTTKRVSSQKRSVLGFGASVPCSMLSGAENPCDPYCNGFDDTAAGIDVDAGGVTVIDGGLVVTPTSGVVPFASLPSGLTSCPPTRNIVGSTCTPPDYATCQQDFHCDAATKQCLWNNGPGYYDPTIAGPDLTIGAPCGPNGSSAPKFPLCNRGSVEVPAGATIKIHLSNPPRVPDGCAVPSGAPDCVFSLTAALKPGDCVTRTYCNNTIGTKFLTVNQGPSGSQPVAEAPGLCANNSAYVKTDATPGCMDCTSTCNTRVLGKVYDPSASPGSLGNNIGLANVIVYQPSKPLIDFPALPTCDTCESLQTPYVTATTTDSSGSFELRGVSPGTDVPIVVQSGRWRRLTTISVTACMDNSPPAGTFHLPKSRTDGYGSVADIPKIAVATGNHDPLECLLLKIGIDSGEIRRRVNSGDANRIQLYYTNGTKTSPAQPTSKKLWNGDPTVDIEREYSAILFGCETDCMSGPSNFFSQDSGCTAMSSTEKHRLRDFLNHGGRVFGTHGGGNPFLKAGNPFAAAASGWVDGHSPWYAEPIAVGPYIAGPAKTRIVTGSPAQDLFRDWMRDNGGSVYFGTGWARVDSPWDSIASVNPATTIEWLHGSKSNNFTGSWDEYVTGMSFETPLAPAAPCGRFVYSSMHTSPSRVTGGLSTYGKSFPGSCALGGGLTEEERALEYQIFQLTACSIESRAMTTTAALAPVTFTRDYQGVCPEGHSVKWAPLYWQASIPSNTSIRYRAATAATEAALPPSPPADAPATALVGTASVTTPASTWDCEGCPSAPVTVDSQLFAQTNQMSSEWLRLYITINPDNAGMVSPVLYGWRMLFDCLPNE